MNKILVIDDDKSICESLSLYLSEEGFTVGVAYTAQDGLKQSQTQDWEIIILDILLSDADGLDVLKEIKERSPHAGVIMNHAALQPSQMIAAL